MNNSVQQYFTLIPSVCLILRRGDKVLLLQRSNTGYMDGSYSLVSGHAEAGEPARISMAREAKEEAGIIVDPRKLRLVHTGHRYNRSRIDLIFETDTWQGEIVNAEPDKCSDLSWFPLDNLPDNTIPYMRSLLDAISQGAIYSEYFEEV